MAEQTPFSPLDPLGPEYGRINAPVIDKLGLSPFEGNILRDPAIKIAPPSLSQSLALKPTLPNRSIEQNVVRTNANNKSIPPKPTTPQDTRYAISNLLKANVQSTIDPNQYAKIYSYDSGPDGNAFYKRYHAYGQETFDKIGFSPLRDNESIFNERTTRTDDFVRMLNYSFVPLLKQGFYSGPKSLMKMLQGDFTSSDREDARVYEEAAAIGQSSKGGVFGFTNNLLMNFAYTGGIIGEAIIEELGAALLAVPTGGASFVAGNLNIAKNLGRGFAALGKTFKSFDTLADGTRYIGNALSKASTLTGARQMWNAARNSDAISGAARILNPLENSFEAIKQIKGADNISNLALLSKTAGGLYRDVRKINMALAESRLEAGMVENHVYDKLYREAFLNNGNNVPSNKELADLRKQAKDASFDALTKNLGLIYVSNAITFDNITGPKGGLRNFIKSTTDDVLTLKAAGKTNFGTYGKVVYDRSKKAFDLQKNSFKQLAKNWYSNPGYKTLKGTLGYFKANFTEGLQEVGQEMIAEATEKYYIDAYKNKTLQRLQYGKATNSAIVKSKLDYYTEALGTQMSTQGLETFGSGFFMGFLASPINGAIPFLSAQYNRMYNKEEYERWKKMQQTIGEGLVKQLNNVSLKEFFHDHTINVGAQDTIAKVRAEKSKKEGLDADLESMVRAVSTMRSTGTTDMFVEKLMDLSKADDKEFIDALNIEPEKVEKYRTRINDTISRIKDTVATYEAVEKKYPLPFDKLNIDPLDKESQLIAAAWESAIHNVVFFNKAYEDAKKRRSQIINKWQTNSSFSSIDARDKDLLFEPNKIYEEINLINNEIIAEKEITNNPVKINDLETRKKNLTEFLNAYEQFNNYFNRANAISKKQKAEPSKTFDELAKEIEDEVGSLEDPIKKAYLLENLKKATDNYVQSVASQKGEKLFGDDLNTGFELLVDYYKLGDEYKRIGNYIDLLDNPDNFLDLVQRNSQWMQRLYDNRAAYNKEVIANELDNANLNSLLNNLANEGVYLSAEELENLKTKGLIPKAFLDGINQVIISESSTDPETKARYESIKSRIEDYLKLKKDLKNKTTTVTNEELNKEIAELEKAKQEEISKLPTKPTETNKVKIKAKNVTELDAVLQVGDYADVVTTTDTQYRLYKSEDGLRYNDENGDLVEDSLGSTSFKSTTKFNIEELPNEIKQKEIEDRYNAEIENAKRIFRNSKTKLKEGEERIIIHQGAEINLVDASLEDLIELRDSTNDQLRAYEEKGKENLSPEDIEEQKSTELTKKLIIEQIDEVKLKNYDPELKKNVLLIRDLINEQEKNPIERRVLEEDDEETGLKKGDTAYFIKGKPYKRLTNAMQSELPDYTYADIAELNKILDLFITGKLTEQKINSFTQALKDAELKGLNDKTIDELQKQLLAAISTTTPVSDARAEIERRQGLNGVEEIMFSNPNFRLEGFEIDGNYWNVVTSTDRAKVLVNINGVIVPFYLTTGQAGKGLVPGWYPFFGIGKDGWLNKTDKSDMETYYERYWGKETADIVKSISEELNSFYGTDPSTFKNDGDPNATSRPLNTLADKVEDYINSKLNYTPAINNADARKTLRSNVEQLGKEINAKYDAELLALKAPVSDKKAKIEAKKADVVQTYEYKGKTQTVKKQTSTKDGITKVTFVGERSDKPGAVISGSGYVYGGPTSNSVQQFFDDYGITVEDIAEDLSIDDIKAITVKEEKTGEGKIGITFRITYSQEMGGMSSEPMEMAVKKQKFTSDTELAALTGTTPITPVSDVEAKIALGQEVIDIVWDRLAKQGITNADSIVGTRDTIENVDFDKFWSNVTKEDLENLKKSYQTKKQQQLDLYDKFKGKFDPSTGTFTSNDTSFFDNKIKLVDAELAALESTQADINLTADKVLEVLTETSKKFGIVELNKDNSENIDQKYIIQQIKDTLNTLGLPYKDVVAIRKSTYNVINSKGESIEILKLLQMGGAPLPAKITAAKYLNSLTKEEKINYAKKQLAALEQPVNKDLSAKKVEIEKRQRVADIITTQLELGVELPKILETLAEQGYVKKINNSAFFKQSVGRDAIVFNIDGAIVPIYRSSQGTSSKTKGAWYPFFFNGGDWLVKAGADTYKNGYNNPIIKQILDSLNKNYKYDKPLAQTEGNNEELLALLPLKDLDLDVSYEENSGIYDFQNYAAIAVILKDWQSKLGNIDVSGYQDYLDGASSSLIKANPTLKLDIQLAFNEVSKLFAEIAVLEQIKKITITDSNLIDKIINSLKEDLKVEEGEFGNSERAKEIQKQIEDLTLQKNAQETKTTFTTEEAKDFIINFVKENSYEDSRVAGNFVDLLKDFFESGKQPAFDEKLITREAYDKFFAPDSFIRKFKEGVDKGDYYVIGNDVRVYDEDTRIAGEIDLLVATKNGILIIDIKTGEASKWRNFHKESPNSFSKKNEYTLQQASYATMLEKMSDGKIKVANIGLLPIERVSNKKTNAITDLSKPADSYPIYTYDSTEIVNGKPIKRFTKRTDLNENPLFIVLDRRSVDKEVKNIFGATSEATYRQRAKNALEKLTEGEFTDIKQANYLKFKQQIENWYSNNQLEIPEELTSLLQQLETLSQNAEKIKVLRSINEKYKKEVDAKNAALKKLQDKLKDIKNPITNISELDTKITDEFIEEQLVTDGNFKARHKYHEETGAFKSGSVSEGQLNALFVLKLSGIISDYEYNSITDQSSFSEASYIIHNAVNRIQYLNKGLDNKEFANYQKDIFSIIFAQKNASNVLSISNIFNQTLENPTDYFNNKAKLNDILINKSSELEIAQKKNQTSRLPIIESELADINNFITNYDSVYKQDEEQFDIEEGTLEEIEFSTGDNYVLKSNPTIKVQTVGFNQETSEVILLNIDTNETFSISLNNFNNDYESVNNIEDKPSEPMSEETKEAAKKGMTTLDEYLKNSKYLEGLASEVEKSTKTTDEIYNDLLNSIKNCE